MIRGCGNRNRRRVLNGLVDHVLVDVDVAEIDQPEAVVFILFGVLGVGNDVRVVDRARDFVVKLLLLIVLLLNGAALEGEEEVRVVVSTETRAKRAGMRPRVDETGHAAEAEEE
ncbi:unnamed protein product [Tilletia laevis]|nr:unnamed protein product [Tilletia laevis]